MKNKTFSQSILIVKGLVKLGDSLHVKKGSSRFICFAAGNASRMGLISYEHSTRLQEIIRDRLHPQSCFESWLRARRIDVDPYSDRTDPRAQRHRRAWLDLLAKEFEE